MKKLFLVANLSVTFSFLTTTSFLHAQIAINTAATPTQMVNNLVGPGITFSNVQYTGAGSASAIFSNGNVTNLGMTSGVVLTTGNPSLIPQNNGPSQGAALGTAGIAQLNTIANATTYDGVILEFDFIPYSNNLSVNYIFGSEEYPEWVNSQFNDAFAFFISGPGIAGQQNLAVVGAQPVTINTINNGTNNTGPCVNCAFYVNNNNSGSGTNTIEYDGFTAELVATRTVIPCSTYHIRLMIADGGDQVYDSGVFIEENGFYSSGAMTSVSAVPAYGLGSAIEGCAGSQFVFTMPQALPSNTTFNFTVGGTATPGSDYVALPSSITIPAGQTSAVLPVNVLLDGITEGTETITLTVQVSPCSTQTFTMNINDPTPINVNSTNASFCQGSGPVNISASATGGNGTITYSWNNGAGNGTPVSVNPATTTIYTVTATDQCGRTNTSNSTVTVTPLPTATFNATSPVCQGNASTVTYGGNAPAGATYNWNFGGGSASPGGNSQGPHNVTWGAAGSYNLSLTVSNNGCVSTPVNRTVVVNPTPATPVVGSNSPVCAGNTINLTGSTIAGATYFWSGPAGYTSNVQNPTIATATVAMAGTYSLYVVVNGCTSLTASTVVNVNPLPTAPTIASNSPVCQNGSLNLTSNTIAGATYAWSGPNGYTSAAQNPILSPAITAMSGTYNAYVVVSGCTSAVSSTSVVVNPTPAAPTIASNSPICSGANLNLTSNTIANATYVWNGPNGFTSGLEDPTINSATTAASGTYSAYVVVAGCTSSTSSLSATVNPMPAAPVVASNSPVCSGNTLNLTSNAVAGVTYVWSGPNGFASNLQNPSVAGATVAASGNYNLYLAAAGCTSTTSTVAVVVNPTPASPVIASNTPLCVGATLNLTASNVAGATYAWSGPNGFASNLQNPSVPAVTSGSAGNYSAYVVVNGCTSATANTNVVVNPIPATPTIGSNSPVCAGNALNLTASNVPGASYTWTGPNSFSSALQNPTINPATVASSGNYSLYAVALGCTSATANANITITPLPSAPVVNSNTPICQGGQINLTSNNIAGATYAWTGPNNYTSSAQNPTIGSATINMTGTYSAYVIVNGCTSATSNTSVLVNPTPAAPIIASNTPVCQGNALNLTSNNIAGATYVWSGPNSFASGLQNPSIPSATPAASGTYSAYVVVAGCTSATANTSVTVNPTPATPVVNSNSPVCAGNTLNLSTSAVAGASYVWTGPNSFASTLQNPSIASVTTAASGNYTLYTVVLGCTSAVANLNATITPLPSAPTLGSNSPVCEGGNLNLTSNTVANATYIWSGPNSFTSATEDPTLTPATLAMGGTYTAYIVVSGCTSAVSSTPVVINPTPAAPQISSNTPVCAGASLNLTSNTINGATYVWSGPNGFSSGLEDPTIAAATVAASGSYSAYVVVSGCTSAVSNHTATVNPIPAAPVIASNTPVCETGTINLTSNTIAGATYVWSGPSNYTSSVEDPSISPANITHAGNYSAYVIVLGCTSSTAVTPVAVNLIPATPTIASNSPICEGGNINLTANTVANATYVWSGPNSFSSSQEDPTLTPATLAMNGNYAAYIVVAGCTSATANTAVVVNPTPSTPVVASNGPLCLGQTCNLTANTVAGATYVWQGPNGYSSSVEDPSFVASNLNMAGAYTLYLVTAGCTSGTATTNLQIAPMPVATFAVTPQVCLGDNAFALYGGSSPANATYNWVTPGASTSGSGQGPINITWGTAGQQSVTLTVIENGCTSLPITQTVNVIAPVMPDAGPDQTLCSGSMVNIGSQNLSGATFTWTTPNGVTDPNSSYSTASWTNNSNSPITVTVTLQSDNQGCLATDDAVMTIIPIPVASFNAPASQCFGNNSFNFNAGGTFIPGATFNWNFENSLTSSSSAQNPANVNFTVPGSNNVTLTITQSGCVSEPFTLPVLVPQGPQAAFTAAPISGCIPLLVNFTNQSVSTAGGTTYTWNFGHGAGSNQASPSHTYTQTGVYSVSLTVSDNSGCSSTMTQNNLIHVHENPVAGFYASPEAIYIDQPFTNVYDGSTGGAVSWNYQISNGAVFNVPNFMANFTDTGYYTITQTVTNQFGCSDVFTSQVHVLPVTEIFIPNAFTPDNNDNINPTFKPSGMNFNEYRMFIYNRWGELLFSTYDVNVGWDGHVRNSNVQAKQDLYVYKIQYVDHRGNQQEILGNVNVIR